MNNKIIIFELQRMRDCWLRGNLNTAMEFINFIDERIDDLKGAKTTTNKTPSKSFELNKEGMKTKWILKVK